jgi:hypothetical protein
MGYTHYWNQTKSLTMPQWIVVHKDICSIIKEAGRQGIKLEADGYGAPRGKAPYRGADFIAFNGAGHESHETFSVCPIKDDDGNHGWFCKTARKPYDTAVTAILIYLESIAGMIKADSDGYRDDWNQGLDLARRAIPMHRGELAIPEMIDA